MIIDEKVRLAERDRRAAMINKIMEDRGLDAAVFVSQAVPTGQLCVKFFSNYMLSSRRAVIFCERGELPRLIVPTLGQAFHAKSISWLPEDHIEWGDITGLTCSRLAGKKRAGWYQPDELPAGMYKSLTGTGVQFEDITADLTNARAGKSEYEVQLTKDASKLAADSMAHIVRLIEPGITTPEELIGAAEGYLRAHGMMESLLLTRAKKPHTFISRALPEPLAKDGLFVYSAEVAGRGGYWTQLVRPIFMTRDSQPEAQAILAAGKHAEAVGIRYLRPGYRICDVGEAIEADVRASGYKTGVWCGHGMGPDLGDAVDIGSSVKMEIVPNMIITLHPSIIGESDGLLYGNTFLTTEGDPINLTDYLNESPFLEDLIKQAEEWTFG